MHVEQTKWEVPCRVKIYGRKLNSSSYLIALTRGLFPACYTPANLQALVCRGAFPLLPHTPDDHIYHLHSLELHQPRSNSTKPLLVEDLKITFQRASSRHICPQMQDVDGILIPLHMQRPEVQRSLRELLPFHEVQNHVKNIGVYSVLRGARKDEMQELYDYSTSTIIPF